MSVGGTIASARRPLRGTWRPPGDKSVSHRAALLAALADGECVLERYSPAGDCEATLAVVSRLGVEVSVDAGAVRVLGRGAGGLRPPGGGPLDCRRSGTTMRLGAGLLAGAGFASTLTGDEQLLRRPMERVAEPLRRMGARVYLGPEGLPPIGIAGGPLTGITYALPVPSAQVKSAVLLAGLSASGATTVAEAIPARDHTERLLAWLGLPFESGRTGDGTRTATVRAGSPPPFRLEIPGDPSSAAFLMAAAALSPGSDLLVADLGLNPGRLGFVEVLRRMGGSAEAEPEGPQEPEPRGTLRVRHAPLHAVSVAAEDVPGVIDELPLVGLLATQAEGVTEVRGAAELRVKESDRIAGLVAGLRALGADAEEYPDGFAVRGPARLRGATCDPLGDHRLAMTFAVAALLAEEPVLVRDMEAAADSFPDFVRALESLR